LNRIRNIIILVSLSLGLGGGLVYLDRHESGDSTFNQVVGALGPGSQGDTQVTGGEYSPAGWVSTGGNPGDPARIEVTSNSAYRQTLDFKLPGFILESLTVGGRKCSRVSVQDLNKVMEAGLPELPFLSVSLVVPTGGRTYFKIVEHETREIKMDPVEPSTGHLTRDIDPATVVPEFSDFYESADSWPKVAAELGTAFTLREYQGVSVRLNPLRYDAGKGALVVSERIVVEVVTEGGYEKGLTAAGTGDPLGTGYSQVYGRLFANFSPPVRADKYQRLQTAGRMLIVSHEAFVPYLQEFAAWKRQRGIDVTVAAVGEVGGTAGGIVQTIKAMYAEPAGLTWVILVGDKAQVPTNVGFYDGSDSDSRYTMIDGNDLYPDLFISRISASNPTQVQTQVNRFISYEKNPRTGPQADWYGSSAGIASDEGSPSDFRRADLLRSDLLGYGFQPVDQIYQSLGGTTADISAALEKGRSLVNYLGHGSGYGWTSVPFSIRDVQELRNNGFWPWIIDVSCSNGDFNLDECFAEAWLRAGTPDQPTGAIAMIASSSLSPWVPPTVMQAEAVDLLVAESATSIGSLYYSGLMRVLDLYSGLDVATQVMEQNVIFGDCSLQVRTGAPREFLVAAGPAIATGALSWELEVDGPAGSVVTLTSDGVLHGRGLLGNDGVAPVTLTSPITGISDLTLTVTGFNMVPHIETVAVLGDSSEIILPEPEPEPEPEPNSVQPVRVTLLGNYPNPFNPSTSIVFELPRDMRARLAVYDVRGSLVRLLLDEVAPAGHQEVVWDGRLASGRSAASGVYLYQLTTAEGTLSGRMLLTK
jgi:hypothetical protein